MKSASLKVLLFSYDDATTQKVEQALRETACARYEVFVATSVEEFKQQVTLALPDAVLVESSSLDGPEREQWRELRRAVPHAPLVAICVGADPQVFSELIAAGADYVVCDAMNPWESAVLNAVELWTRRVQERQHVESLELAKTELEKQVARLEQLYETAYRFVDNVSHEFRTPLTVINDFASIVRDELAGTINQQQREHMDVIAQRVEDLTAVVNDMFEMSQLEAGRLAIKRRVCRVGEILEGARPTLEHKASRIEVQLSIDVAEELPDVFCDPDKVRRILVNLVDDSLAELVAGGHVEVTVRHVPERWQVEFQVTDDGPGKSEEVLRAIHEHFAEIDAGVRSNPKGLDLGLYIAKELVHLNLGNIEIESQGGRGTTYRFTLPTADIARVSGRYLDGLRQLERTELGASLILVTAPAETTVDLADDADDFLCRTVCCSDLLFRVDARTWLLLTSGEHHNSKGVIDRIESERKRASRNRPGGPLPELQMTVRDQWDLRVGASGDLPQYPSAADAPRRVLLVDDDRDIVEGAAIRLQTCGFDVLTAYDGHRALDVASKEPLDAILLDIRMPGLDGLSVLRQLRNRPESADVPVAIMSGSVGDKDTALRFGAQYFLTKPYQAAELMEAVEFMSTPVTDK